jgi:ketosteroid isomerase-like protein
MRSHMLVVALFIMCSALASPISAKETTAGKSALPDKAHLQKIWDGWATLDPTNVAQFYASGPHTFFDIAPLKYSSWDEYQKNVRNVLADYKSAKFTVNNDAELHPAGKYVWGSATVNEEMTHKGGKVDTGTFRWTMVFEQQGGKWLIVHEHVSIPAQ